ncbi:hypothetical protein OXX80_010749 [Metschnikowia pulcherrima]
MGESQLAKLARCVGSGDNPKSLRISLTKDKLSQLSVAKSHSIYELQADENAMNSRPWRNSPKYFTQVLISTIALVKMSAHAKSGGSIEVMGMLTGKIVRGSFIVMDVYSLPVEGTETRVNAQNEAYEYMVQYLDNIKKVRPEESIVGWYHSHPGYGCWLSGIDVATQSLNQNFQDPYLAIVVDPLRTKDRGKVEIGAFRTFPVGYVDDKGSAGKSENNRDGTLSENTQDMGVHSDSYYSLDIKLFKGPQDDEIVNAILNKSWVSGIAQTQACELSYQQNVVAKIESSMKRSISSTHDNSQSRYERLFERLIAMQSSELQNFDEPGHASAGEGVKSFTDGGGQSEERVHEEDFEAGEINLDADADADADVDADNDSESHIDLDVAEKDNDAQSLQTRDMDVALDSDDASLQNSMVPDQMGESSVFEEYEAGNGITSAIQQKGTKRNIRASSDDAKAGAPFGSSMCDNRKRFATGAFGSAVDNELKHKMQSLQLELQYHVRETKSIGQAELSTLVGKRAKARVFGQQEW